MKKYSLNEYVKTGDIREINGAQYKALKPSQGKSPLDYPKLWQLFIEKNTPIVLPEDKPNVPINIGTDRGSPLVVKEHFRGLNGRDGLNGLNGRDGIDGLDGKDGLNGKDGKDGLDGVSLDFKWKGTSLGIRRSDQLTYAWQDLQGPKGDSGVTGTVVGGGSSNKFVLTSNGGGNTLISTAKPTAAALKSLVAGTGVTLSSDLDTITITATGGGGGSGGHTIQEEGSDLTTRTNLNFIGPTVTAADDAGNDATTITIDDDLSNYNNTTSGFITASSITTLTNKSGSNSQWTNDEGYITDISGDNLSTLADVTITSIASGELLKWNGSAWVNNTLAEAGIAAASHTHATSDITSGTFADARIAESNVTQHQAALTITESQISDLGSYIENISGFNTGDLTEGVNLYFTDERAQDAIGTILVDSSEIDFTYSDITPSITASIVAGSIDESKLDTSVNASLDLADSSIQPSDNISTLTNDAGYITASSATTLTNKTIDAASNTISNLDVADFAAATIVTESEGIASNDNDTTLPTSAAVKDFVNTYARTTWVPSDPTGATNMAAELETFVSANQGKLVTVAEGSIILLEGFGQQGNLGATDDVLIDARFATIRQTNNQRCFDLDNTANAGSEITVSSLVDNTVHSATWATTVTLASTGSIAKHDWVAIYSDDANPSKSGGRLGEIHQVLDDETTLSFNLVGTMERTSDFSTNIKLRKLDASRKVHLILGTIESDGDADDVTITSREEAIRLIGFVGAYVDDVTFDAQWAQGVWLQCCAASYVRRATGKNTLNQGGSNGYSYVAVLYGMNGNCIVEDTHVINCRHGVTTDGDSGSPTSWYQKGYPTNCKFLNTKGDNCYGSVADTHEEGSSTLIDGVYVHNAVQDGNASFVGVAVQSRGRKDVIRNVTMIGGAGVIKVTKVDHGAEDQVTIQNVYARDIKGSSDNAKCINIESQTTLTNKRKVFMDNIDITSDSIGIFVGETCKVQVGNMRLSGMEDPLETRGGCEFICTGKHVWDFQGINNGNRCVKMRSHASYANPKVYFLQPASLLKGTGSGTPTHFFEDADTTTNKHRYVPWLIEYNPDGVTATLVDEASATTLVDPPAGEINYLEGQLPFSDITKVGTPANKQIAVWTGDGTLSGDSRVTVDVFNTTLPLVDISGVPGSGTAGPILQLSTTSGGVGASDQFGTQLIVDNNTTDLDYVNFYTYTSGSNGAYKFDVNGATTFEVKGTGTVSVDPIAQTNLTTQASTSFTTGQIGYIDSAGTVQAADASAESTGGGVMLVMAQGTVGTSTAADFMIQGIYTTSGLTAGAEYYLSETAKGITTTAPSTSGAVVRVVGYALSSTKFYFNPSTDWIEVA